MKRLFNKRGFTLVEMMVVMVIFAVIMLVTSATFSTIVNQVSQQQKSAETLVEGIVGLEVLRSDVKQAGFGLPWSFQAPGPSALLYKEAQISSDDVPAANFWPSTPPPGGAAHWITSFNDAPNPPRAVQSAETMFNHDSDNSSGHGTSHGSAYLVLKSMLTGTSPAAKKWTNVAYSGGAGLHAKKVWNDPERDLAGADRVIVVKNSLNTTPPTQQLMVGDGTLVSSGTYFTRFDNYSSLIRPHQDGDTYEIYGVDSGDLTMPFNRSDYYVRTPATGLSPSCAPHTGLLYKASLRHSDGQFTEMPLLDCVADMQVVYGLDSSGSGMVNLHSTASFSSDLAIRNQLREIRVYVLSHEGKKDRGYNYPSRYITVGEDFGGIQGRVFDLQTQIGGDWQKYRWKVHTIVVRPKNFGQ